MSRPAQFIKRNKEKLMASWDFIYKHKVLFIFYINTAVKVD